MNARRLATIQSGTDRSPVARLARAALSALAWFYAPAVAMRNRLFDWHLRNIEHLPRPVISVGNLTAGGTGKTPMVVHLAQRLTELGAAPAVLLRGYHARNGLSDEAAVMQRALAHAIPVEADARRGHAAQRVIAAQPHVSVFLLDDGFQHRQTHRQLDLVLIDATLPFGYDHLLPRGLLREPVENLRRASAVIVTRADQISADALADLDDRIAYLTGQPPIAHVAYCWRALIDHNDAPRPVSTLRQTTVAAAAGIGNPDAFFNMVAQASSNLTWTQSWPDHHTPTARQLHALLDRAQADNAAAVVTTEKDWVKWQPLLDGLPRNLDILRPDLALNILDGEHAIHALLRKTANRLV